MSDAPAPQLPESSAQSGVAPRPPRPLPPRPPKLFDRFREDEREGGGTRMGFLDHLMELRNRLWKALAVTGVCMALALIFSTEIFALMRGPSDDLNRQYERSRLTDKELDKTLNKISVPRGTQVLQIISADPLDTTLMMMWLGVYAGVVLASPMLLYQLWAFVAPGLRDKEKRAIKPILYGGIVFFLIGCLIAYGVLFPVSIQFFVWLNLLWELKSLWSVEKYVSLLLNVMVINGLICEIPLVIAVLARLGIVAPRHLTKYWRFIILACFILGAVISPGNDIMSMLVFTAMILSLYIVSLLMTVLCYKKQAGT